MKAPDLITNQPSGGTTFRNASAFTLGNGASHPPKKTVTATQEMMIIAVYSPRKKKANFNTEYSGVKFAFFFLGEYTAMIIISCVAVTVFFGGWLAPFPNVKAFALLKVVPPLGWFVIKSGAFIFLYIWFRSTFPRYRFDQLMALGWKWMIPAGLVNIVIVAVAILVTPGRTNGLVMLSWIFGLIFVAMFLLARLRQALTRRDRLAAEPAGARKAS